MAISLGIYPIFRQTHLGKTLQDSSIFGAPCHWGQRPAQCPSNSKRGRWLKWDMMGSGGDGGDSSDNASNNMNNTWITILITSNHNFIIVTTDNICRFFLFALQMLSWWCVYIDAQAAGVLWAVLIPEIVTWTAKKAAWKVNSSIKKMLKSTLR